MSALLANGRLVLAGVGKYLAFALAAGGGVVPPDTQPGTPQPGSPTTMVMQDFVTGDPGALVVVQRKAGVDAADIQVYYSYTGSAPGNPQARVVRVTGGAVVKDWTTLANVANSSGTGIGVLPNVGIGGDYYLQLRDGNAPANSACITNGTTRWGVGGNILFWGQSNEKGTFEWGSYGDIVPGTSQSELDYFDAGKVMVGIFGVNGWVKPAGGKGVGSGNIQPPTGGFLSFARTLAAALKAKYGFDVPVGIIPRAFGSTGIEMYYPNGSMMSPLFNGSGTTTNVGFQSPYYVFCGDYEGMAGHQGENNQSDTAAAYLAKMQTLYTGHLAQVSKFGRTAATFFYRQAMLGPYNNNYGTENLRKAVLDLEAYAKDNGWPRVKVGWNCIDLDPSYNDGLHFGSTPKPFQKMSNRRLEQTVLYELGAATFDGVGPRITSVVSRTGNVVRLKVTHGGGTALVALNGAALSGFAASDTQAFTGSFASCPAVISGADTIDVTLPGAGTWYLKYMGGLPNAGVTTATATAANNASAHPDLTNPVYDNATYADGMSNLPLLATPDSLTIA